MYFQLRNRLSSLSLKMLLFRMDVRLQITCNVSHISSDSEVFTAFLLKRNRFFVVWRWFLCFKSATLHRMAEEKNVFIRLAFEWTKNLVLQVLGFNAAQLRFMGQFIGMLVKQLVCVLELELLLRSNLNDRVRFVRWYSTACCSIHELVCKAFKALINLHGAYKSTFQTTAHSVIEQIFRAALRRMDGDQRWKKWNDSSEMDAKS